MLYCVESANTGRSLSIDYYVPCMSVAATGWTLFHIVYKLTILVVWHTQTRAHTRTYINTCILTHQTRVQAHVDTWDTWDTLISTRIVRSSNDTWSNASLIEHAHVWTRTHRHARILFLRFSRVMIYVLIGALIFHRTVY